ncbi:MAG TPA: sulfatase [Candidatus Hydrogenedentes bacterium]|nr:sulfatase [Candidatus Hydrogenedentota bacterium]
MRRCFLLILMGAVTGLFLLLGLRHGQNAIPSPKPEKIRSVVLIVVDALRADRVFAERNGAPLMPNLARLAGHSWTFESATSQAAWTKPSMASLLTSLYPATHGIEFGVAERFFEHQDMTVDKLPEAIGSAATYFKNNGYRTGCIQTNRHLAAEFGFAQGFDAYWFKDDAPANVVTSAAIEALRGMGEPFFLYVHYLDPHAPYAPPADGQDRLGAPPPITEKDRELLDDYDGYYLDEALHKLGLREQRERAELTAAGRARVRWLYDGELRFVDDELGRLVEYVETAHPECVIVVTADHGEELWDHGSVGHSKTLYQELIHVPLIMRLPSLPPRSFLPPAASVDVLPSVSSYLGLGPNPDWQGRDLLGPTPTDGEAPQAVFAETRGALEAANLHLEAVILHDQKLTVDRKTGTIELYDLAEDPLERNNQAIEDTETVKRLLSLLDAHIERCRRHPKHAVQPEKAILDAETIERLRKLGYLREE